MHAYRILYYMLLTALATLCDASITKTTNLLLPLYIWPDSNTTWRPVYEAAAKYTDVLFQVIINPDSGPGSNRYPEPEYIAAIAQLCQYDNIHLLGYIPIQYASRSMSEVISDITKYSGWSFYRRTNITLAGAFFDEVPPAPDAWQISYMEEIAREARSRQLTAIVFNPGTKVVAASAAMYFEFADLIVEFENTYRQWISTSPAASFGLETTNTKAAAILYSTPVDVDYSTIIDEVVRIHLGAVYITNTADYKSLDTVQTVASALDKASG